MIHTLPELPYSFNALEPVIDAKTVEIHYSKHHQTYLDKTNQMIVWTEFENASLEGIVMKASGPLFNNAAQTWNHTFYRESMTDQAEKKNILLVEDQARLIGQVKKYFWDMDTFKEKFSASAVGNFWSGWTWLVANPDWSLEIVNTSNAENPLRQWKKPLLVLDVWEHAYYLNYQNKRADYVSKWFDLVNWEKVSERMGK